MVSLGLRCCGVGNNPWVKGSHAVLKTVPKNPHRGCHIRAINVKAGLTHMIFP